MTSIVTVDWTKFGPNFDPVGKTLWNRPRDPKPFSRRRVALCRDVFAYSYLDTKYRTAPVPVNGDTLRSYVDLAEGYAAIGEDEIAEEKFRGAMSIYNGSLHSVMLLSRCLCGLGALCTRQGRFREAIEYLTKGFNSIPKPGEKEVNLAALMKGRTLGYMGQLFRQEGDDEGAVKHFASAIEIMERVVEHGEGMKGYKESQAGEILQLYYQLGKIYLEQKDWEKSIYTYKRAYQLCDQTTIHAAEIMLEIGRCYEHLGAVDKACDNIWNAVRTFEAIVGPGHEQVAICYEKLAKLTNDTGDETTLDRASFYSRKAVESSRAAVAGDFSNPNYTATMTKCMARYAKLMYQRGKPISASTLASEASQTQQYTQPADLLTHADMFKTNAKMWASAKFSRLPSK